MQTAGCSCSGKLGNSGRPNVKPFGITAAVFLVPILADDGSRNSLDLTSTDLGGDLLAMVNNVDPSKRAYPYHNLINVTFNEADPTYETVDNGERFKIKDGVKTVAYDVYNVSNQYYDKVSGACVEFGMYAVDTCGNLKGEKDGDNLYPRVVNQGSFNSMYVDATSEAKAKVHFEMDYSILSNDGDQWMIPFSEFGSYNALQLKGMIDVYFELVEVTDSTTFVVDAQFGYGSAVDPLPWRGGLTADFSLYNETDEADVALDSVTEDPNVPGRYTIVTTAAVDATDNTTVDCFRAATGNLINGYEGTGLTFQYSWT